MESRRSLHEEEKVSGKEEARTEGGLDGMGKLLRLTCQGEGMIDSATWRRGIGRSGARVAGGGDRPRRIRCGWSGGRTRLELDGGNGCGAPCT